MHPALRGGLRTFALLAQLVLFLVVLSLVALTMRVLPPLGLEVFPILLLAVYVAASQLSRGWLSAPALTVALGTAIYLWALFGPLHARGFDRLALEEMGLAIALVGLASSARARFSGHRAGPPGTTA